MCKWDRCRYAWPVFVSVFPGRRSDEVGVPREALILCDKTICNQRYLIHKVKLESLDRVVINVFRDSDVDDAGAENYGESRRNPQTLAWEDVKSPSRSFASRRQGA